ncbi:MAG: extracellular solute-binding protein [Lachnospiraceae bacterium]|nr:extracellular solute-binding protein [Lachnospiraceae bacterium]
MRLRSGKVLAILLSASLIFSTTPISALAGDSANKGGNISQNNTAGGSGETERSASGILTAGNDNLSDERLTHNYTNVSAGYVFQKYTGEEKVWNISEHIDESGKGYLTGDNYWYENEVAKVQAGDRLVMSVDVPQDGLYFIGFDYLSYDGSILPIELSLMIDGEYPFYESRSLKFETTWASRSEKSIDRYGNEIVVMPDKLKRWEYKELSDSGYRYSAPLMVELSAGMHELTIGISEGHFLLGNIRLVAPYEPEAYTGSLDAPGNELITVEAEDFYLRNDSSIHAIGEYDTAITPTYIKETKLNTIDEASFDKAGQTVSYEINVVNAGYYHIALNYRQSERNGFPVFINYKVDGQIPNSAFENYPMADTTKYTTTTLTDSDGKKLSVYLEPGQHTISMTISADPVRYALEEVDRLISEISDLSLEVTKVAGTNKDKYRDLKITRYIPGVAETMQDWVERLYAVTEKAGRYVGTDDPEKVAAFSYLMVAAKQLKTLAEEPNDLVYRVDELSTSSNSINTQIANFVDLINKNNIAVDRIYIYQEGAKLPGKLGFFASLKLKIGRFFNSFFGQSYSSSNTDKSHIQVWVNRPRQYVEIMQKMIDDSFTPKTGIQVDLSLMTDAQKLILSNASGDTPDIATGINYSIPFELAIRGALVDMTKFDNYREVFGRYSDGILVPSVVGDGLYSLPETMNFYVLFCRTDILDKLGLSAPDTLDDLIAMLPDLQMRGLNVFYPSASMSGMRNFHATTPIVYQNGGVLYGKTALELMLDSERTVYGFTELTELFTLYDLPVDVPNFYQHFRNGDLAMGIADFNSYNLILNAAPEIANSWSISPIPGVYDASTGKVNRFMSGGAESSVMFSSNDEREKQAWDFLEWWSSTEIQAEFGQMLQIMYGDEYIWPTANLEAFKLLPYPTSDKDIILEQAEAILEAPRLLGSYMLEREMSNAFNDIVVNGETVRSRIDDAVKVIDREVKRKLEEFGYIDEDGNVLETYFIPSVERVRTILSKQ